MKIGVDIRSLMDKNYSGVSEYTFNLLNSLLAIDTKNEYILFYNSGKDISQRMPKFDYQNAKIIHRRYPNKIFNYLMQKCLGQPKIDQLLGVDIFFAPHINFFSLSANCKKIITAHDVSFLKFRYFFSLRKNIWHYILNVKKIFKKFDQIIAISENTKNDLVEICDINPEEIKVIYSGVSDKYRLITDKDILNKTKIKYNLPDKFLLYLGNLEPRKNVDSLITAFDNLKNDGELKDYKLVMAGANGWKTDKIQKTWQAARFKDDIVFLGYIDNDDKPALYNLAAIFLYPTFYEGFGFPVLEAMACGTPVITSSVSSLPEIAGQAAVLIDPYKISDLEKSITLLTSNIELRNFYIKIGLIQAAKFSWQNTAKKYLNSFSSFYY